MILYLDSSSLTKHYLREPQSDEVRMLLEAADRVTTSVVAYAETRAALARAFRSLRISNAEHRQLIHELDIDWQSVEAIECDAAISRNAGELAAQHYLRGLDAIHLASALTFQSALGEPVTFSAFDDRLNEAAADSGLSLP